MGGGKKSACGAGRQRRSSTADSATLEDHCHPRKIFIGGLACNTTTQDLRGYFGQFGSIVDAVVLRWPDGRSRGFGYVTFADAQAASVALSRRHTMGGQEVDVKRAVPGTNKLFVGGLPQNTMAAELREHFEPFGVVSDAVVMIDPATGRSRGFGFVCFTPGQEGAAAVTAALDQYKNHHIRGKWIEVKSAAPPHKFVSQEAADSATPASASAAPPSCPALPVFTAPPVLRAMGMSQVLEDYGEAPLPKLLGPPGRAESKKIRTPATMPGGIGAPPGLGDPIKHPFKGGSAWPLGEMATASSRGSIPWPGARVAAHQMLPPGAPQPRGDFAGVGLRPPLLAPPPDRFEGGAADAGTHSLFGACANRAGAGSTGVDLSTSLQRSLEELVRLKMRQSVDERAPEAAAAPDEDAAQPRNGAHSSSGSVQRSSRASGYMRDVEGERHPISELATAAPEQLAAA